MGSVFVASNRHSNVDSIKTSKSQPQFPRPHCKQYFSMYKNIQLSEISELDLYPNRRVAFNFRQLDVFSWREIDRFKPTPGKMQRFRQVCSTHIAINVSLRRSSFNSHYCIVSLPWLLYSSGSLKIGNWICLCDEKWRLKDRHARGPYRLCSMFHPVLNI